MVINASFAAHRTKARVPSQFFDVLGAVVADYRALLDSRHCPSAIL